MCSTTYTSWLWFHSEKALDQTSKISLSLKETEESMIKENTHTVLAVAVEIVSIET